MASSKPSLLFLVLKYVERYDLLFLLENLLSNSQFILVFQVKEVGPNVTTIRTGDRVIGLKKDGFAGFAEECIALEQDLWTTPGNVQFSIGASLIDTYGTALLGLHRRAEVEEGQTVLVTAAAGGLGLAAVDLAANVYKAKVIFKNLL